MIPQTKEKPVAFLTLYSGFTFIKIPKHDLILGIQHDVNKVKELIDENGRNILMQDGSMKPAVSVNATPRIVIFTNDEYMEQMSLIDKQGMK